MTRSNANPRSLSAFAMMLMSDFCASRFQPLQCVCASQWSLDKTMTDALALRQLRQSCASLRQLKLATDAVRNITEIGN
jgi:hypothetical protein